MAESREGTNVGGLKNGVRIAQHSKIEIAGKEGTPHQRDSSFRTNESCEIPIENARFNLARNPISFWALC